MDRFLACAVKVEPIDTEGLSYHEAKELLIIREAMLIELENPTENINRPGWRSRAHTNKNIGSKLKHILDAINADHWALFGDKKHIDDNLELSTGTTK
jgi:hypothetical protein